MFRWINNNDQHDHNGDDHDHDHHDNCHLRFAILVLFLLLLLNISSRFVTIASLVWIPWPWPLLSHHNSMITYEDLHDHQITGFFVRITFFVTLSPSSLAVEFWIPKEKRCKSAWQECCAAVAYILVPSMSFVFILVPAHTLLLEFLRINPKWNPHLIAWCACNGTPKLL